jgi:twinkle protein
MLVSASAEGDERRTIDSIMTRLRSIVEETGAGVILVSHLRGSQSIAQLSDCVLALERNQQSDDHQESQTTKVRVLKSRYTGDVGLACNLLYDSETGRLKEISNEDLEVVDNKEGF